MTRKTQAVAIVVALVVMAQACSRSRVSSQRPTGASAASPSAAQETLHWSYGKAEGPARWSTLRVDWKICGEGRNQSPIDIEKTAGLNSPELKEEFKPASLSIIHKQHAAHIINNGHSIEVEYADGDMLQIGDEQFQLLQYHFHSPSEHTVHGKHYPMEMHLVHKSAGGKLAVVGVFIEEGKPNPAFDLIWTNLPTTTNFKHHIGNVTIDIGSLLPRNRTIYRYDGSLTTPPCSEEVKWIIMTAPIHLSSQQIEAFRAIIKDNNRPIQALNGRSIITDRIAKSIRIE